MTKYSDIKLLPPHLQYTVVGKRYLRACLIMRMTVMEIRIMFLNLRLRKTTRNLIETEVRHLRHRYITYSDLASIAVDELSKRYGYPIESAADESFTWLPTLMQTQVDPTPAAPPPAGSFRETQILELLRQGFKLTSISLPPAKSYRAGNATFDRQNGHKSSAP